jgi:hypothetical protein
MQVPTTPQRYASMTLSSRLFLLFSLLLPFCIALSTYLYAYPFINGCGFAKSDGQIAPFRLLALGDPQLEGDTSLPYKPTSPPRTLRESVLPVRDGDFRLAVEQTRELLRHWTSLLEYELQFFRKQLDLFGNDFYLAQIYHTLDWWLEPTHVTVLGDLLGSQWIHDEEFASRSSRFWQRVFSGAEKVPDERIDPRRSEGYSRRREVLGDKSWRRWLINIPGNHDIGYAGDINEERMERFEREFGPAHGDVTFTLPQDESTESPSPSLRILVLNSMNLDGPVSSYDLQLETYNRINDAMGSSEPVGKHLEATVLLTHIPLHKPPGVCFDSPLFTYHDDDIRGVKEQNLLSGDISRDAILQGIFGFHTSADSEARGMGRDGIILTGHDHEGCDVYHYADRSNDEWKSWKWEDSNTSSIVADNDVPGVREVTVRSMMGEFGGNAALLTASWDDASRRWKFEVSNCAMGVQHIWWAAHILAIITALTLVAAIIASLIPSKHTQSKVASMVSQPKRKNRYVSASAKKKTRLSSTNRIPQSTKSSR